MAKKRKIQESGSTAMMKNGKKSPNRDGELCLGPIRFTLCTMLSALCPLSSAPFPLTHQKNKGTFTHI